LAPPARDLGARMADVSLPLPLLCEDEISLGHIERLRRWTGATSVDGLLRIMRADRRSATGQDSALHTVAKACGISIGDYLSACSMLPFSCFLVSEDAVLGRATPSWSPKVVHALWKVLPSGVARFCHRCVEEQLAERPYAVWRRRDQLPGRSYCRKHEVKLHVCDPKAMLESGPDGFRDSRDVDIRPAASELEPSGPVSRFSDITGQMLSAGRSWPARSVRSRLIQRGLDSGFRATASGAGPLLSDAVFDCLPRSFVADVLPFSDRKRAGEYMPIIDSTVSRSGNAPTPVAVALALTVLFDDAQSAFDYVTECKASRIEDQ
jgi:hypothetical protein